MINLYAFTYRALIEAYAQKLNYIRVKFGDTHRDVQVRMNEQGGSSEAEKKIIVGTWPEVKQIGRDYQIHRILRNKGWHEKDGAGTEWFNIYGATTVEQAFTIIDNIITELEGNKVRKSVKMRSLQQRKLNQAMDIIDRCVASGASVATILANLCPRFGKTIWALMLFNAISKKYGNRIMLLPAYWLSAHSSFINELDEYADFIDIAEISTNDVDAKEQAQYYLSQGMRIAVTISLHGELEQWKIKHQWLTEFENKDVFNFADEGDFGTHTENQVAKMKYLFDK